MRGGKSEGTSRFGKWRKGRGSGKRGKVGRSGLGEGE